jgi:hypothetical protein
VIEIEWLEQVYNIFQAEGQVAGTKRIIKHEVIYFYPISAISVFSSRELFTGKVPFKDQDSRVSNFVNLH